VAKFSQAGRIDPARKYERLPLGAGTANESFLGFLKVFPGLTDGHRNHCFVPFLWVSAETGVNPKPALPGLGHQPPMKFAAL
jgi:hypothetical protein